MILYVTPEQETAIKLLFTRRAWMFNNLEKKLAEDVKVEILRGVELAKTSKLNSASTGTTLVDKHRTPCNDKIEGNQSSTSKKYLRTMSKDIERQSKVSDEINLTDEKMLYKTKLRKIGQRIRQSTCRRQPTQGKRQGDDTVDFKSRNYRSENSNLLPDRDTISISNRTKQSLKGNCRKDKNTDCMKNPTEKIDKNIIDSLSGEDNVSDGKRFCKERVDPLPENEDESSTSKDSNNTQKNLKCDKCSYRTKFRSNLNRHVREIHSGVRHKCSKCDKTFKGKHDAKMHELYGHTSGLQCKECDKKFSSVSGLRNHVKIKHKKSTLYQCKHCEMKFYYKSHYLGHINKHLNVKPFSCKTCEKPFRYKVACHLHEKTCSRENFYITHNSDGSLKQTAVSKCLCDICGLELTSKSGLKLHHYYTHTQDTTTVCSLCGKSFKGTYSLQRHIRNAHENTGTIYPCPDCGKEFSQQQILKQHIKIHQKAFTCFCETCGKGFLSRFKMTEHSRMHTGEKPFTCPHCQHFKCATKTNLQKHMRIHEQGRVPRQKQEKKDLVKKPKAKGKSGNMRTGGHEGQGLVVQMSTDSYDISGGNIQDEVKYTNLPQMVLCDGGQRYSHLKSSSYGNFYKEGHYGNHEECESNTRLRTNYASNEYSAYSMSVTKNTGDQVESYHRTRTEEQDGDNTAVGNTCENECQSNCDNMQGQRENQNIFCGADVYYSGDSTTDTADLPQGLNILTVAMNIVNPSDY